MNHGDVIADRFEIDREAGSGGMGTVYRALDRVAGGAVALKVLHGAGRAEAERFAREVNTLAELSHPAIVRYVASGTTPRGERFLAMEWLDGQDLAARLAEGGLTLGETLTLGARVADALGALHRRGFVHRDLKPSNLFLVGGPAGVRLLDFGIARRVGAGAGIGAERARAITRTGVLVGTPEYMAPEQARGARDIDARADVFALGCVLFECLTGQPPYVGETLMAVLAKILMEDPPRLRELRPDVPPGVCALIDAMMSRDPARRPVDGADVAARLAAVARESVLPPAMEALVPGSLAPPPAVAGLTSSEQRVVCVVLARACTGASAGERPRTDVMASTEVLDASGAAVTAELEQLVAAVEATGARVSPMADGSLVAVLAGSAAATDLARRGARCALAVRRLRPGAAVVLATGRGVLSARMPVGEVIDRAVGLLSCAPAGAGVRIDEATAGLIDARFDVGGDGAGLYLRGERPALEAGRTLLGAQTVCVGRDRELGTLESVLAECVNEPVARAVLVTAAAGAGKTRLLSEFVQRVRARGTSLELFAASGDPVAAGSPFGMLGAALRDAAGVAEGEAADVQRRKLRARVARHVREADVPRVTEFLAELCRLPPAGEPSDALRAARTDPQLMNDAMRSAWETFLAAECAAQPVLLAFDDLHWGDLPTVQFVDSALRNLRDEALMVVALARPEVHQAFPGLWSARDALEVRLSPLTRKAAEKLVRSALGARITDADVSALVERAEGNPFYLEELVRAVAAGTGARALPDSVLAMLQARLDALGDEARRVLRAASVFGQTFWRGGVLSLLGGEARTTDAGGWLDELCAREVIARGAGATFAGEAEYVFRNALLRDAAYAMLTEQDRELGHRLAAAWLERAGEPSALVLAEHYDRGGEAPRAVEFYRRAAEHALAGNDFVGAVAHAERGVALGAVGETLGALRLIQAEAHGWHGEQAQGRPRAEEAAGCFVPGTAPWFRAVTEAGLLAWKLSDPAGQEKWFRRGIDTEPEDAHEARAAKLLFLVRSVPTLTVSSSFGLALEMDAGIEALATVVTDVRSVALLKAHRANVALFRDGDPINGMAAEEEATEALRATGDERGACLRMANMGFVRSSLGDVELGERLLRESAATAARLGLEYVLAVAEHNLGYVRALHGEVEGGRAMIERALRAFEAQQARRLEGGAYAYLSHVSVMQGDLARAEREARRSLELSAGVFPSRADALTALARALLAQGRAREAAEAAEEATAMLPAMRVVALIKGECGVIYARALDALGDREAGVRVLRERWAEVLRMAGRMAATEFRERALRAVRPSVLLRALAAEWGVVLERV